MNSCLPVNYWHFWTIWVKQLRYSKLLCFCINNRLKKFHHISLTSISRRDKYNFWKDGAFFVHHIASTCGPIVASGPTVSCDGMVWKLLVLPPADMIDILSSPLIGLRSSLRPPFPHLPPLISSLSLSLLRPQTSLSPLGTLLTVLQVGRSEGVGGG